MSLAGLITFDRGLKLFKCQRQVRLFWNCHVLIVQYVLNLLWKYFFTIKASSQHAPPASINVLCNAPGGSTYIEPDHNFADQCFAQT